MVATSLVPTGWAVAQDGGPLAAYRQYLTLFEQFYADNTRILPFDDGSVGAVLIGNVHLRTEAFDLWSDRVAVWIGPEEETVEPDGSSTGKKKTTRPVKLYAEGRIVLFRQEASFRGESVFYDSTTKRAVITDVRARAFLTQGRKPDDLFAKGSWTSRDPGRGDAVAAIDEESLPLAGGAVGDAGVGQTDLGRHNEGSLVLAAKRMTLDDFRHLSAEGIEITTCDFGVPHWSLSAKEANVTEIPREQTARDMAGDPIGPTRSFLVQLSGVRFNLWGESVLPLPPITWDTYWNEVLPIRSAGYSSSSKFGNEAEIVWNGNLLLPRFLKPHVDLGLRTEYLSKRGFGYGVDLELGDKISRWSDTAEGFDLYGRGVFFAINDRGRDRGNIDPETNDRSRVRYHQRLRLPTSTLVDLEYAIENDRNFLNEYYQSEVQGQKAPENLIYLRQPFGEDVALTLLAKKRMVSYRTVTERLPEIAVHILEKPIADTGLRIDTTMRGSSLRFLPDDVTAANSRRMLRGDVRTVLSTVLGKTTYGKLRPFIEARGTAWEEDINRTRNIERLSLATGGSLGWHLGRTFRLAKRALGVDLLRHVLQPDIAYRFVFENNVDPNQLFPYDTTEQVRRFQVITFGLRQFLFGRKNRPANGDPAAPLPKTRKLVEAEVEIDYFPDSGRDNARDNWGPLRGELLLRPVDGIGAFVDGAYNVENGGRFDEANAGVTFRTPPAGSAYVDAERRFEFTVANRFTKHRSHSVSTHGLWKVSEQYELGILLEEDVRRHKRVNQVYSVTRHFHRWSMLIELEIDEGEDNVGFHVQFAPRDLLYFTSRRR